MSHLVDVDWKLPIANLKQKFLNIWCFILKKKVHSTTPSLSLFSHSLLSCTSYRFSAFQLPIYASVPCFVILEKTVNISPWPLENVVFCQQGALKGHCRRQGPSSWFQHAFSFLWPLATSGIWDTPWCSPSRDFYQHSSSSFPVSLKGTLADGFLFASPGLSHLRELYYSWGHSLILSNEV